MPFERALSFFLKAMYKSGIAYFGAHGAETRQLPAGLGNGARDISYKGDQPRPSNVHLVKSGIAHRLRVCIAETVRHCPCPPCAYIS